MIKIGDIIKVGNIEYVVFDIKYNKDGSVKYYSCGNYTFRTVVEPVDDIYGAPEIVGKFKIEE